MSSAALTFHFSVTLSSGEELDLRISKMFSKINFLGALRPQKRYNDLSSLIYCRLCQCYHACQVLAYAHVSFGS